MVVLSELFGTGRAMLLVGAVLLYVASRAGAWALVGRNESPGRRAVGNWLPIAAAVGVAIVMRRGDWALTIIFATSVGCLSLLLGTVYLASPNSEASESYRRVWPFALPAALLALLVGFTGILSWRSAGMLLIEGAGLLFMWSEIAVPEPTLNERIGPGREGKETYSGFRAVDVGLCVLMGVIGAIAGELGARHMSREFAQIPDVTIVVAILSPILVLPMLTGAAQLAKKNRASDAVTAGVAVVLLNICLLLPMAALLWYVMQGVGGNSLHSIHFNLSAFRNASPMAFGWVTWRVDSVVLVVLSLALLPVALGRWKLGRSEGLMLIFLYGIYVLMETGASYIESQF